MSKRKGECSNKSAPAAKKMSDVQNEGNMSAAEEKVFAYHQDQIDVSPLYLATKLADVHFVFDSDDGTVTRVPAHKTLLAVTSDVFEKMFCGELKESGDVEIVDASEAAFKEFLQFFYLNDVKLSAEHVASVMYLGDKYNVENCCDACGKFIADGLSNENVCAALSLAITHEHEELTKACEKQIVLNAADIIKTAGFVECSKEALARILQMNELAFSCSEVDVFEACMEWVQARARCKQEGLSKAMVEEHLGALYYQIRFVSMTPKEFCALKTKYSAVLSSDFEAIIRLIIRVDTTSEYFNTSLRQVEWNENKDAIIKCSVQDLTTEMKLCDLKTQENIIFSTNGPLVLGKFECNELYFDEKYSKVARTVVSADVEITEARALGDANDVKVLCTMKVNLSSDFTTAVLPHPILIRPDFFYTICFKGFPKEHRLYSCKQKSSMTLKSNIKIEFHNDGAEDGKAAGLIWNLDFNRI